MTMRALTTGFAAFLLLAFGTAITRADDKEKKPAETDPAKVEELMKQFAKPGKPHEQLKRLVGAWNTEVKSWHADPQAPSTSQGTAKFSSMMGGRYLRQDFRGEFDGKKYQGMGLSGYDNAQKKYIGIWIDNHGTGIMHSEGTYDVKTNTLTETAVSSSPLGEMKMKMVSHYVDQDKFLLTMYAVAQEGEQKMMEITYTRAESKGAAKQKP